MRRGILISTLVVAVGSFLPWASVFGVSVSGIEGDGVLTLILAGIGFALALVWKSRRRLNHGIQAALAVLALIVAGYHFGTFAAMGVYVTFFAAGAWLVISVLPSLNARRDVEQAT